MGVFNAMLFVRVSNPLTVAFHCDNAIILLGLVMEGLCLFPYYCDCSSNGSDRSYQYGPHFILHAIGVGSSTQSGTSIRAKKALGRHFLRDENILRKIASVAEHIHPVFPW